MAYPSRACQSGVVEQAIPRTFNELYIIQSSVSIHAHAEYDNTFPCPATCQQGIFKVLINGARQLGPDADSGTTLVSRTAFRCAMVLRY